MELLILGGTAMLGRAIAQEAMERGHVVTCLARGTAPAPSGTRFVRADRTSDDGLRAVTDRRWSAVLDVSRQPGQVRRAVRDLRADHVVFISSANVYADHLPLEPSEDSATLPPLDGDVMENMDTYWRGTATLDCTRARAAGLVTRPLIETLRAALASEDARTEPRGAGLTDAEERDLRRALDMIE